MAFPGAAVGLRWIIMDYPPERPSPRIVHPP